MDGRHLALCVPAGRASCACSTCSSPAASTSIHKLDLLEIGADALFLLHLPQFVEGSAGGQYEEKLRESKYCLAVYGYGYGMRLSHAMMTNCVPVIVQVGWIFELFLVDLSPCGSSTCLSKT